MAQASTPPKVRCRQIQDEDLSAVASLLTQGFPARTRKYWTNGLEAMRRRAAPADCPRYGYLLDADGVVVGALILIFSERPGGRVRCNVSSWFVAPDYRPYAAALVSAALKLKHVTYVNISAAEPTWPILAAQGYRRYTEGQFVAAPALAPAAGLRARSFDPCRDAHLCDHATLAAHAEASCIALVCERPRGPEPFVFLRRRLAYAPFGVAQLIYARRPEAYAECAGALGRVLLARGVALVISDAQGPVPGLVGRFFKDRTPRFYRGPEPPALNDLTFTELVLFGP